MKRTTMMIAALALLCGSLGQAKADLLLYSFSGSGDIAGTGSPNPIPVTLEASFQYNTTSGFTVFPSNDQLELIKSGIIDPQFEFSGITLPTGLPTPILDSAATFLIVNSNGAYSPYFGGLDFAYPFQYEDVGGVNMPFHTGNVSWSGIIPTSGGSKLYGESEFTSGQWTVSAVPEPSGIVLLGMGIVCLAVGHAARRRTIGPA